MVTFWRVVDPRGFCAIGGRQQRLVPVAVAQSMFVHDQCLLHNTILLLLPFILPLI